MHYIKQLELEPEGGKKREEEEEKIHPGFMCTLIVLFGRLNLVLAGYTQVKQEYYNILQVIEKSCRS